MSSRTLTRATARRLDRLRAVLERLRARMLAAERQLQADIDSLAPSHRVSARNLTHYLALRQVDIRPLQEKLSLLGISSLGRAESHILANLGHALDLLYSLSATATPVPADKPPVADLNAGMRLLEQRARDLLGPRPAARPTRIMVTLPSEAATAPELARSMIDAGMDIARINCARDDATAWRAMAAHVRAAAVASGRNVRILMDLAGPKLRTGEFPAGPAVCKLRPQRDVFGRVIEPGRLTLRAHGCDGPPTAARIGLGVDAEWLQQLRQGETVSCIDARGARRSFAIESIDATGALAACRQSVYLTPDTELVIWRENGLHGSGPLTGIAPLPYVVRLAQGQQIDVVAPANFAAAAQPREDVPLQIPCSLPEIFADVRPGERIFFDDGRIGGVVRAVSPTGLRVEIVQTRTSSEKLGADKGINLPDSRLCLPALTAKDCADLPQIVEIADMIGFSFVQRRADVHALQDRLAGLGASHLGLILKVETPLAFANLPELIFAAMRSPHVGIMIARGDLAIECGFARLAEVQEEILWVAEAAHLPTIWATQVLEGLAKTGMPSRAEITDAAMGERAECVMLNKGPHIAAAIHALDDILRRMQTHQRKKRGLLRGLTSCKLPTPRRSKQPPASTPRPGAGARGGGQEKS